MNGPRALRGHAVVFMGAAAMLLVSACQPAGAASGSSRPGAGVPVRIGYLANLTHATAMVGLEKGFYTKALGRNAALSTQVFNAGPAEVEALFAGALDAAFMGPSPAINAYVKSHGAAIRIVSGAAIGGAELVVRPGAHIRSADDLRGKRIATPQLGNTQDVALRYFLAQHGMKTDPAGGGDVKILPTQNSTTVQLFESGQIDGAWVPEPYASTLVDKAGGKVLIDEASLWPGGRFPTTLLAVSSSFLRAHPAVVTDLLKGLVETTRWMNANPDSARAIAGEAIAKLTGKGLPGRVLDDAWRHLGFTYDPLAPAIAEGARHAEAVGLLGDPSLKGIADLAPLNSVLTAAGAAPVAGGGLQ